jgi:aryl-alcohol dehydrogenase-like predicted oxidoreductase
MMEYRKLGQSNLEVSLIGYGGWALSGKGWGDVNKKEALETVEKSIENGINFFDTAPVYGFGKSEELLGILLSSVRKKVIIATKCGLRWDDRGRVFHDLTRDAVLRDIESSLARLKTDYIDLYQIHWPDKKTELNETLDTLNELKKDGVIRFIGLSNFNTELLGKATDLAEITSLQALYNMLQRDAEREFLPFCKKNRVGFICYSPLAQGILSGKINEDFKPGRHDVRRFNPLFRSRDKFRECIAFTKELSSSTGFKALKFLADKEEVSSILISMTKVKHLMENLKVCA